ncbi:PBECR2 nuclease fold domain-containing protein [Inquilinus limosus]|uniref:PBECR2 nuclease fold domain-containing protein n=1 Tax=Inquilinus limosus TaxID=171674 RepID=UPI0003FE8E93|nr:PBECR2 nuclease fold domain-containing protein [Inquilinus limosus]
MAGEAVQVAAAPVHFVEAIDYFRSKVNLPTNSWSDLMHQAHTRAFSVAGATSTALLADFREALDRAISAGGTLETFRQDFDRIVAQHGWAYRGGRNWRSRVIFETNVRMAYSSGRWQQAQRLKATRPYARYVDVHDSRTRPEHYAWHDIILPIDHPWWRTHWPPNGWNCRCHAQSLSERDLKRFGLKVTIDPPEIEMEPREVRAPDGSVETVWTPKGIDTGFGYNPGDSWMRGVTPPELRKPLPPPDVPAPASPPPPMPAPQDPGVTSMPDGLAEEDYVRAFLRPFGADIGRSVVWRDPSGSRITLSDELFRNSRGELKVTKFDRHRQILALAMAILDPDEIWVDWQNIAPKDTPPKWRLRRRYIRRFDMDGRKGGIAIFGWMDQGWSGATAFPPDTVSYLDRQRTGVLLYQRP